MRLPSRVEIRVRLLRTASARGREPGGDPVEGDLAPDLKTAGSLPITGETIEQGRAGLQTQGPTGRAPIATSHPLPSGKGRTV
jgi:hypothetical protein